jgi:uncharacterized membrane protein
VNRVIDVAAFAHATAGVIEVFGICVIIAGGFTASVVFARELRRSVEDAYHRYRKHLGRAILLGLELFVAADIIGTVAVEPTFRNVGVLAGIVLIRTFLSFSLEVEVNGRWPWQKAPGP